MGMFDTVEGIIDPWDPAFKVWSNELTHYKSGDEVPKVGMADTYAIRINAPAGVKPMYLWVQEGKITNVMAMQPIYQKSVFNKWGKYLGQGGEELDEPGEGPVKMAVDIVTAIKESTGTITEENVQHVVEKVGHSYPPPEEPSEVPTENPYHPGPATLTHRFNLRPDLEIQFQLPTDLDDAEAERLSEFIRTLPF